MKKTKQALKTEIRSNYITWFVALYLNIALVKEVIKCIFFILTKRYLSLSGGLDILILSLPIIAYLYYFIKTGISVSQLVLLFVWSTLHIYTFVFQSVHTQLLAQSIYQGLTRVVFPAFIIAEVNDEKKLERSLQVYIYIAVVYTFLQIFYVPNSTSHYYTYSYSIMLPVLLTFAMSFNKKPQYLFLFFIFVFSNILIGTRGALLCFFVEFILILYFYPKDKKNIIFLFLGIVGGFFCLVFYKEIFSVLAIFFPGSRTFSFLNGEFSDNYRSVVWRQLILEFFKEPLKIRGVMSDRMYLGNYFFLQSISDMKTVYSHNFIVEIIFEFGIWGMLGIILFIVVFYKTMRKIKLLNDSSKINLFISFSAFAIGKLSISSSYLIDMCSGMMLGILIVLNNFSKGKGKRISL